MLLFVLVSVMLVLLVSEAAVSVYLACEFWTVYFNVVVSGFGAFVFFPSFSRYSCYLECPLLIRMKSIWTLDLTRGDESHKNVGIIGTLIFNGPLQSLMLFGLLCFLIPKGLC